MSKLTELIAQQDSLLAQAQNINDTAAAREDEGLNELEEKTMDDLLAKAEGLQEEIDALRDKEAKDKARQERLATMSANLDAPQPRKTSASTVEITGVKDRVEDDPKAGFKSGTEFFYTVMKAQSPQGYVDNRLAPLATVGSDEQTGIRDPDGGFLVPEGFLPEVLKVASEGDPVSGLVRNVPMQSPVVEIPARVDKNHTSSVSGGLTVSRRPETTAITSSTQEYERVRLEAKGLWGLAYVTDELMADSPISVPALLADGFAEEFQSKLMEERLTGTGVGEFEGINNSPAAVTVAKESGQSADTIVYANLVKMYSRMWGIENAVWMVNHDTLPQLMQMVDAGNNLIWQKDAVEGTPSTILGRPVIITEHCETLGDKGDILFVNWREYLQGNYSAQMMAESAHVRFIYNERAFKVGVRNAGSCWWRSALTPKNSSVTLSPIVNLAARA